MGSQQNNGTSYPPSEPKPCANNCGFFGTSDNQNLCSKCYKQLQNQLSAINTLFSPSAPPPPLLDAAEPSSSAVPSPCAAGPSKPTNRCGDCNRKVGLTGFLCKCGITFCGVHRYPEKHQCTHDFKSAGREEIAKENPVVKADKIQRRLDIELHKLTMEYERQQKEFQDDIEGLTTEGQHRISEAQKGYSDSLEKERMKYQKNYNKESIKVLEEKVMENKKKYEDFCMTSTGEMAIVPAEEVVILKKILQKETLVRNAIEGELNHLKNQMEEMKMWEASRESHISKLRKMLEDETHQKENLKGEIARLQSQLLQLGSESGKTKQKIRRGGFEKVAGDLDYSPPFQVKHQQQASGNGEEASVAKLCEQGGLQKILSLLEAENADAQIHAVKIIANLACEERNQKKIVEAGGLTSLLTLLKNSTDETTHRIAASAIANLAMNETNQDLIAAQGGIHLLSITAANAEDPQTLRMVAGAIANLFGNDKLQMKIRDEGGIKALLGMTRCKHPDVHTQVARAIANFAKCESKASIQGIKVGRSSLIVDGLLPWIVKNASNEVSLVRRDIEIALCHLAKHEANARDMISGGAIGELVRVSRDCSREDIRILARETLISNPAFQPEIRRSGHNNVE